MSVTWIGHRFAGGALALDVANTVVLRGEPQRRFDRFENRDEIARFAAAAAYFRKAELKGRRLAAGDVDAARLIELREATDRLFRDGVQHGRLSSAKLPDLLRACAGALDGTDEALAPGKQAGPIADIRLETAIALSALLLLPEAARVRRCDSCGWLFLDRSRNGSRRWCDMNVCGNRQKAKRHYMRRVAGKE